MAFKRRGYKTYKKGTFKRGKRKFSSSKTRKSRNVMSARGGVRL